MKYNLLGIQFLLTICNSVFFSISCNAIFFFPITNDTFRPFTCNTVFSIHLQCVFSSVPTIRSCSITNIFFRPCGIEPPLLSAIRSTWNAVFIISFNMVFQPFSMPLCSITDTVSHSTFNTILFSLITMQFYLLLAI